jgi:hypothetical protein
MAYNGSGTFVRLYDWETDKANSEKIQAARMDAEMDGFATGLSTAITKDGQTTTTVRVPFAAGIDVYDGLVGSPAVRFSSDTNTGIYRIGTDEIGLALGGVVHNAAFTRKFVAETTSTGVASVDFTTLPSGTKELKIRIYGLQPTTDATNFLLRLSTDNGATFLSGASSYAWQNITGDASAASAAQDGTDTAIQIAPDFDNTQDQSMADISVFFKTASRAFVVSICSGLHRGVNLQRSPASYEFRHDCKHHLFRRCDSGVRTKLWKR